mmetsp:Transcript_29919/g.89491  ORF Transcript_29919/g.89491 Transcript_29919/m.89491 type:complete len:346 (+) Transcript_29919:617-1654(+)
MHSGDEHVFERLDKRPNVNVGVQPTLHIDHAVPEQVGLEGSGDQRPQRRRHLRLKVGRQKSVSGGVVPKAVCATGLGGRQFSPPRRQLGGLRVLVRGQLVHVRLVHRGRNLVRRSCRGLVDRRKPGGCKQLGTRPSEQGIEVEALQRGCATTTSHRVAAIPRHNPPEPRGSRVVRVTRTVSSGYLRVRPVPCHRRQHAVVVPAEVVHYHEQCKDCHCPQRIPLCWRQVSQPAQRNHLTPSPHALLFPDEHAEPGHADEPLLWQLNASTNSEARKLASKTLVVFCEGGAPGPLVLCSAPLQPAKTGSRKGPPARARVAGQHRALHRSPAQGSPGVGHRSSSPAPWA